MRKSKTKKLIKTVKKMAKSKFKLWIQCLKCKTVFCLFAANKSQLKAHVEALKPRFCGVCNDQTDHKEVKSEKEINKGIKKSKK